MANGMTPTRATASATSADTANERNGNQLRARLVRLSILLTILLGAALIRVSTLDNHGVWIDETWAVTTPNFHYDTNDIYPKFFEYPQTRALPEARRQLLRNLYDLHPVVQICYMAVSDMHPPLYWVLSYYWTRLFGESLYAIRSFPVLTGVATVLVVLLLAETLFGLPVAIVAGLLLAASPMHVHYSQMARNYSLATFLVSLSYLMLFAALRGRPTRLVLACYGFTIWLALLTNYYTVFFVAAQLVHVAIRTWRGDRKLGRWAIVYLGVAICYAPWLPALYVQTVMRNPTTQSQLMSLNLGTIVAQLYALGLTPSATTVLLSSSWFNFLSVINAIFVLGLLGYAAWKAREQDREVMGGLLFWIVVPVLALGALSLVKPMYSVKALLPIVPGFCIVLAFVVASHRRAIHWIGATTLLLAAMLGSQWLWPTYPGIDSTEDTRGAVADVGVMIQPSDDVYVSPASYRDGVWYYLRRDYVSLGGTPESTAVSPSTTYDSWLFRFWDTTRPSPIAAGRTPDETHKFFGVSVYHWRARASQ